MKRHASFSKSFVCIIFSILMTFVMVFSLLPHDVLAKTYHIDFKIPDNGFISRSSPNETKPVTTSKTARKEPDRGVQQSATIAPVHDPALLPEQIISYLVPTDNDTQIKSPSGKINLKMPKGSAAANLRVDFVERTPRVSTGLKMINSFNLNARTLGAKSENVTQFSKDLEITIRNSKTDIDGLNPASIKLYYIDPKTSKWVTVESSKFDPKTFTLTATVNHFTEFGEQGDPLVAGPGRVTNSQVNLNSGAATFSYPIELPPGPGKFVPKLEMVYNSGVADGMKSKKSMGSWVGIGWTLHLGRINFNESNPLREYSIELNNASYALIPLNTDYTSFRCEIDDYSKITRNENTFELWDKDGTYYRFGGNTDSRQTDGQNGFRANVDLIQDTNGNQATVTYTKNQNVSCYPEYLNYGNTQVHFISSFNRPDNPIDYCWGGQQQIPENTNRAPAVREDKRLDAIEIITGGSLVRKYQFTYYTTDCVFSTDYNGIYYSGKHELTGITQVGADGSSQLPSLSFTYQDLRTYFNDETWQFITYPDNPMSLSWPHLTRIDSGYGGLIDFSYQETPSLPVSNIWTREVVVAKSVDGGIGPTENNTYFYTGGPHYNTGIGPDAEYLGFDQVKVTDSAGNYSQHYYYTFPDVNGNKGEVFSGREYKTQWYDAGNNLLRETDNNWVTKISNGQMNGVYLREYSMSEDPPPPGPPPLVPTYTFLSEPQAVVVMNNSVYIANTGANEIKVVKKKLKLGSTYVMDSITGFSSWLVQVPDTYDGLDRPRGLAIAPDLSIYIADHGGHRIVKYDGFGTKLGSFTCSWLNGMYDEWGMPLYDSVHPEGIAISSDNKIYVADADHNRVFVFNSAWSNTANITSLSGPQGVAVSPNGNIYVADTGNNRIVEYDSALNYLRQWGSLSGPQGVAIAPDGNVYVADTGNNRIAIFSPEGSFIRQFGNVSGPQGLFITKDNYVYVADTDNNRIAVFEGLPRAVQLAKTEDTVYTVGTNNGKTTCTRYLYDDYGNVITQFQDADISTTDDDSTVQRVFYPNTTANILSKPARERVYAGITDDVGGSNLKKETIYYYDSSDNYTAYPVKGDLARLQQKKDASNSANTYYTYDTYGNLLTTQDPNGGTTTLTYDSTSHIYPIGKTFPISGISENYTFDPGTYNYLTQTDANDQVTTYQYDTFKRLCKVLKPGDSEYNPSIQYQYNDWGTLGQQNVKTLTKVATDNYSWETKLFDGLGRVLQTQSRGETDRVIISGTSSYNNCGQVEKGYVPQDLASASVSGYKAPEASWRYSTSLYDGLGRVISLTNADNTTVTHNYATAWQEIVTNEKGVNKCYYYDAFKRLTTVEERTDNNTSYAFTRYSYDTLGNLIQVRDAVSNNTTMTYDWLSRKTAMADPDMGSWSYSYDNNGNLISQTDAKGQTVTMTYDAMNRITAKNYPAGSNTANVTYTYDQATSFSPPAQWQNNISLGTLGPGKFFTSISNLTPGNTYYYQCSATDATGTTWANSTASFVAGTSTVATPSVTNAQGATAITATSAKLVGQITSTGGENPIAHICWGTTDGGAIADNWQHNVNLGAKPLGTFNTDITGLSPNTQYYYRCFAINSAGYGWASNSSSFVAQDANLIGPNDASSGTSGGGYAYWNGWQANYSGTVSEFKVKCTAAGHVKLALYTDSSGTPGTLLQAVNTSTAVATGWNTINVASTNVTAGAYYWLGIISDTSCIAYQQTDNPRKYLQTTYSSFNFTSSPAGLSSTTAYYDGIVAWGQVQVVTPSVTNANGASLIGAVTARLNGQITNTGGENPDVHICWGSSDGGTTPLNWGHDDSLGVLTAGAFSENISGLSENATYYYRCYALNSAGTSFASSTSTFSTTGWLTGWNNRKTISVARNASDNLTNYQLKLVANYGSGPDSAASYKAVFSMQGSNSSQFSSISGVSNYTIQSGDYLEYNIMWTATGDKVAFDYTCTDGAVLRGNATDQNGLNADPLTDLSAYAVNSWYSRKIALPASHTGKTISYFDIACRNTVTSTRTAYISNVRITNGAGTVRKTILLGNEPATTATSHISYNGSLTSFTATDPKVYLNAHCKSNFDDLRFTAADGATTLNYWIESKTDNTSATVWVKLNSVLSTGANFYLYYGNNNASPSSNGTSTFLFFDNFDGDLSQWNTAGSASDNNSVCTIVRTGSVNANINAQSSFGTNTALRTRLKSGHTNTTTYNEFSGFRTDSPSTKMAVSIYCSPTAGLTNTDGNYTLSGGWSTASLNNWAAGTYAIQDVIRDGSGSGSVIYKVNDSNTVTITGSLPTGNMSPAFYAWDHANASLTVDWVLVRSWTSPEPSWNIFGNEEAVPSIPGTVINNTEGATNVASTSAQLNGDLVSCANGSAAVTVHCGPGDGAGNYGIGKRTTMTDASGTSNYVYDARGRLVKEQRIIDSITYVTKYAYDGADRLTSINYPTGENVTQSYNGRGLPFGLSGDVTGTLVASTSYNQLGQVSEINLGNGLKTSFGYWGVGGANDNSGGYYGKLWEIKTIKQPGGSPVLQDVQHTWDAGGNLSQRRDVLTSENETFAYDFLDRLTGVSGPYTESFSYNQIGNIMTKNGAEYTYGAKPHAVTVVGAASYTYDNNGNMTNRGSQVLTWDAENRPVSVTDNGTTSSFIYDGDGKRIKKTEGGQTIVYINQYYEKNVTTSNETSNYYLGSRIIAQKKGTVLQYLHQDSLNSSSLTSDVNGNIESTIKYFPFGGTRSGSLNTDVKYKAQRLDETGLYFYGARYYDPQIGRFISADTIVQYLAGHKSISLSLTVDKLSVSIALLEHEQLKKDIGNSIIPSSARNADFELEGTPNPPCSPQALNRYIYVFNNPLKYVDCGGRFAEAAAGVFGGLSIGGLGVAALALASNPVTLGILAAVAVVVIVVVIYNAIDEANKDSGKTKEESQGNSNKPTERSTGDKIKDAKENPDNWKEIGRSKENATNKGLKGGKSERTLLENKQTGERLEQHKLYDKNGNEIKSKTHYGPDEHDIPVDITNE